MHWAGGVQVITEQRAIAGRIIGVTGHWAWFLQKPLGLGLAKAIAA